ncbi:MAG: radical SAM protein, partial [Ruminococcaceae bacterium]|nr:radical SAM protein [Oscillospiraceae bacterium]
MTNSICAPSFLPDTAVLEITKRCSHSCLFCSCPWYSSNWDSAQDLGTDEWKEIIFEFAQNGVFRFSFSGGECTLRDDFEELLKFTSQLRIKAAHCTDNGIDWREREPDIVILSNGKNLTRDTILLFHSINAHLSISLPGLSTFPELTGTNGTAKHVLDCFKTCEEIGLSTTAAITVTKKNFFELYETISAALISGAGSILLNRYLPGGRGLSHPELRLDYEEIKQIPVIAEDVLKQAK